ncbi:MAG: hypothetical protein Q7U16_03870 [Agitococcus sp.]|nr:hypothetical protein [Agitococcus sp.]
MEYVITESQLFALESTSAQIGLLITLASQVTKKEIVIEQHFFSETMNNLQAQIQNVLSQIQQTKSD